MNCKIKLYNAKALPQQMSADAACFDVIASEIIQETPDFVICKLGFALEFSPEYCLELVPRSSITKTKWIVQNTPGQGDADYRGEYQLRFRALPIGFATKEQGWNMNKLQYPEFPFKEGERIGQIYFRHVIPTTFEPVEELSDTERGTGGFGSTKT